MLGKLLKLPFASAEDLKEEKILRFAAEHEVESLA